MSFWVQVSYVTWYTWTFYNKDQVSVLPVKQQHWFDPNHLCSELIQKSLGLICCPFLSMQIKVVVHSWQVAKRVFKNEIFFGKKDLDVKKHILLRSKRILEAILLLLDSKAISSYPILNEPIHTFSSKRHSSYGCLECPPFLKHNFDTNLYFQNHHLLSIDSPWRWPAVSSQEYTKSQMD